MDRVRPEHVALAHPVRQHALQPTLGVGGERGLRVLEQWGAVVWAAGMTWSACRTYMQRGSRACGVAGVRDAGACWSAGASAWILIVTAVHEVACTAGYGIPLMACRTRRQAASATPLCQFPAPCRPTGTPPLTHLPHDFDVCSLLSVPAGLPRLEGDGAGQQPHLRLVLGTTDKEGGVVRR